MNEISLKEAAPIEQREALSQQEVLEACPIDGPLTMTECKARQNLPEKKKKQRGGQRHKLLQQRRIMLDLLKAKITKEDRQRYKESLDDINNKLRKRAK